MTDSKKPAAEAKSPKPLGARAFAAISAVEGLRLGRASRRRLAALRQNESLTPADRRAEVLRAYMALAREE